MGRNYGDIVDKAMAVLAIFLASVGGMLLMAPGVVWVAGILVLGLATAIQFLVAYR